MRSDRQCQVGEGLARLAKLVCGAAAALLVCLQVASGAQVFLALRPPVDNTDGSPLTDLSGFKVHYGTNSRVYDHVIDLAGVPHGTVESTQRGTRYIFNVPIDNLDGGRRYYFAVTACNAGGVESEFSDEMTLDVPAPQPDIPGRITALTAGDGPDGFTVFWNAQAGMTYLMEMSADLISWASAPNGPQSAEQSLQVAQSDGTMSYRDVTAGAVPRRYYRIRVVGP